jgi:hypothetical protein
MNDDSFDSGDGVTGCYLIQVQLKMAAPRGRAHIKSLALHYVVHCVRGNSNRDAVEVA